MSTRSRIGLLSLTALVISSMIGSGIFSLPQNMAAVAGSKALLIGWLITGVGIIFLGLSFSALSRLRPLTWTAASTPMPTTVLAT